MEYHASSVSASRSTSQHSGGRRTRAAKALKMSNSADTRGTSRSHSAASTADTADAGEGEGDVGDEGDACIFSFSAVEGEEACASPVTLSLLRTASTEVEVEG